MKLHLLSTLQGLKDLKNNLIRKAKKISLKQLFIISQKTLTFQTSLTQYTKINRQTKKILNTLLQYGGQTMQVFMSVIPLILCINFFESHISSCVR